MDIQTILAIAAKHNNPETEIQWFSKSANAWMAEDSDSCSKSIYVCADKNGYQYRIKPQTITLNGEELPRPISKDSYNIRVQKGNNNTYNIRDFSTYNFKYESHAQAWADALDELMGESK